MPKDSTRGRNSR